MYLDTRIANSNASAAAADGASAVEVNTGGCTISHPGPSTQNSTQKQRYIESYLSRPIVTQEKTNLDNLLLNMIAIDCQPFSIVDDEGFKAFVYGLNPNYKLPDRKKLSTLMLSSEYKKRLEKIRDVVDTQCVSMCITVDCWTSRTMQPYMAITGHFINKTTLDFKSILLQCNLLDSPHTGENIADEIRLIIQEWNLVDKINFFVTDNAANMQSAAYLLGFPHYGCYAHTLNLVAQHALTVPEVEHTLKKIKKTVAHFKRSSQAKSKLIKYQINSQDVAEGSALTLIMSVPTRWNSTFLMLQRFVDLQEAIRATVPNLSVDLPIIPLQEWQCLEQYCVVLKPLYEATLVMSGENHLTASKAIVITEGLLNVYEQMSVNSGYYQPVKTLINEIHYGLKQKFANLTKNMQITVCTFLDPRFKQFALDELTLNATIKYITDLICGTIREDQSDNIPKRNVVPFSLWSTIEDKISQSKQPRSIYTKVTDEIDMYMKQEVIDRENCPLEWWRRHKTIYPSLFLLFIKKFNIIVTSMPCERAFSKAGHIISDRRTRLTSSKVAQLMFLHGNKNF